MKPSEIEQHIAAVVAYLHDKEKEHFDCCDEQGKKGHIFNHVEALRQRQVAQKARLDALQHEYRKESALHRMNVGDWRFEIEDGDLELQSQGMFVKCGTDSQSLAKAAADLAALAEKVAAAGY